MPRFFFDLVNEEGSSNCIDQMCEDAVHASELADALAKKLVDEEPETLGMGFLIVVRDDHGKEIFRVKLAHTVH